MSDLQLDHVLIAVHDLDLAGQVYANRLGFILTEAGIHPGRGTHNQLVLFGEGYLELIAIRSRAEAEAQRPDLVSFLQARRGLYTFALGTQDLKATMSDLRNRGLPVLEAVERSRRGQGVQCGYSWQAAQIAKKVLPGAQPFLIQHNSRPQDRFPNLARLIQHPNGVVGIRSLSIAVRDAIASASRWQEMFGLRTVGNTGSESTVGQRCRLQIGNGFIEFISPVETGPVSRHLDQYGESPHILCLESKSLDKTWAFLVARGVEPGTINGEGARRSFLVEPAHTCGIALRFTNSPAG